MPSEEIHLQDYGAQNGKLASHRWLGANTVLSKYYAYNEQLEKTIAFMKNQVLNVDIFGIERNGGKLNAPLGTSPIDVAAGDDLVISVVIQNKGIAHNLIPEQRDFYECWVEFEASDAAGHTLIHSGGLRPSGELDPSAHSFTNRLVNSKGTLNDHHQVWDTRIIAFNNTIISGRSQIVRYEFKVPPGATGPITLTAKVDYRRFNQHFIDFGLGKHYDEPLVEMASRTRTFILGANPAAPPDPQDNPEWMRWNNYGIGLLDAQQYAESVHAFEHVAALRPDYADAYTNIAISNFSWQRYDDSRTNLEHALKLAPHNARALYYMALVERQQGPPGRGDSRSARYGLAVSALARRTPRIGLLLLSAAQLRSSSRGIRNGCSPSILTTTGSALCFIYRLSPPGHEGRCGPRSRDLRRSKRRSHRQYLRARVPPHAS